jgi:hypothetical protein
MVVGNMGGIEIHDMGPLGFLAFDLRDLLNAVGPDAALFRWRCSDVDCTGVTAKQMHDLSDRGINISGQELAELAAGLVQVIDGDFEARDEAGAQVMLIRAIDSSFWEVFADEPVLKRVKATFRDCRPAQCRLE